MTYALRVLWDTHSVVFDASKITYKDVLRFLKNFDWRTGDNLNPKARFWLIKQSAKQMRIHKGVALYKTADNSVYYFQVNSLLRTGNKLNSIAQKLKSLEFAEVELSHEEMPSLAYQQQWFEYKVLILTEIRRLKENSTMSIYNYILKGGADIKEQAYSDAKNLKLIELGYSTIIVPEDSVYFRTTNNIEIHFSEKSQIYFFTESRYYKDANLVRLNEPSD